MKTRKRIYSNHSNALIILALFTFITLFAACQYSALAQGAKADTDPFNYSIKSHALDVRLDVKTHFIVAQDNIEIELPDQKLDHIAFMLNSNLEVNNIQIEDYVGDMEWEKRQAGPNIQMISVKVPESIQKKLSLKVEYKGEIYDPVIKAKELGHLRGDVTAGLICDEGVYLAASTYWYPVKTNELSIFNIKVKIIDPYKIVTQGELKNREVVDGFSVSRWESHIPADGLALVAGKYVINTKTIDGIKVSTYFFEEDVPMSDLFLDAAIDYIKLYSDVLGLYPYKKFDVVENFFSTGYGMPSYTLLGNYVIKRGKSALHPGYLDHEIVHSWFGNYVFNDARKGNWIEAMTTYCANYYYKERKLGEDQAIGHRKNASLKYSIRVSKDKDYPVQDFVTKTAPYDNEIGYTKGSMVFHQLRQTIGDETFFKGLKTLVKEFGGKFAEWKDVRKVFERVSKRKLGWFFFQWVEIKGAPELRLENVSFLPLEKGFLVKGEVAQLGSAYKLNIPIHIDTGSDVKVFNFEIAEKRKWFEYEIDELPISIALDPDYHLFRRISDEDIRPCLNAFLEDKTDDKFYVYPDKAAEGEKQVYRELVEKANQRNSGQVIPGSEITSQILDKSLFLAGDTKDIDLCRTLFDSLPEGVKFGDDSFTIDGEEFKGPEYSLILSFRNPMDSSNFITTYFGLSSQAISRARYIFFYGWDSYVVFKNGRLVKRGNFIDDASDTFHNFPLSLTHPIKSENIMKHIKSLASDNMAGRYPGTEGNHLASAYIKRKFSQYRLHSAAIPDNERYEQNFGIKITDLKDFHVGFKNTENGNSFKQDGTPFSFSPNAQLKTEIFFAGYGIDNENYSDYKGKEGEAKGKAVLILDGVPDFIKNTVEDDVALLFSKIDTAQKLDANAVILYASSGQIKKYAPYLAYPSKVPESLLEIIKRKKQHGAFSSTDMELVGLCNKAEKPSIEISIPVVLIPFEEAEDANIKKYLKLSELKEKINNESKSHSSAIKGLELEINIAYQNKTILTKNVVGMLKGNDPKLKNEIVVLGAHYDHLGKDEKGNIFFGADDNASGIAALLEIARTITEFRDQAKRTVVFVAFGAEEWGLSGSRFFVDSPVFQDKKIVSMLNMDSIGKGDPLKVWIIGSSIYPELSQIPIKYIPEFGLQIGDNIDRHAFKYGSDHYPFHLKGIPAIDFFSTNYKELHKITDTWDLIDAKKVEKVCKLVFMTLFDSLVRS